MAARRHLERRLGDVDAAVETGLVDVGNLPLDGLERDLGGVHEDAARQPRAAGVDLLGHGEDDLAAGAALGGVGEVALEELLALAVAKHGAGVDEAGRMGGEAEQLLGRAAHGLEVDHLDAEERHAGPEPEHVAVPGHLRRIVVDVEQAAAAARAQDDLARRVGGEDAAGVVDAPGADHPAAVGDQVHDGGVGMLADAPVRAQLPRQRLGQHVAGGVVVVDRPRPAVVGEHLEVELAIVAGHEFGAPGAQVLDHADDVADPGRGQLGVDELAAVPQNLLEVKRRAVAWAQGRGEASAGDGGGAAGRSPLARQNDADAGVGAFEAGHGARRPAADDEDVGHVVFDRKMKSRR